MRLKNVCLSLVSNGKPPSNSNDSMIKWLILRVICLRVPLLMPSSIILASTWLYLNWYISWRMATRNIILTQGDAALFRHHNECHLSAILITMCWQTWLFQCTLRLFSQVFSLWRHSDVIESTNITILRFLFTENLFQSVPKFEGNSFNIGYITIQFINGVPLTIKTESRDCTCCGSGATEATEATGAHRSDSDRADIFVLGTTIR